MKWIQPVASGFLLLFLVATSAPSASSSPGAAPSIHLSKTVGPPTTRLVVPGRGFGPVETVDVDFDQALLATAVTDPEGEFSTKAKIPRSATPGDHTLTATGEQSGLVAQATFTVRTDWPMFRFSLDRRGVNPYENVLSPSNVGGMVQAWAAPTAEGILQSPDVVGGVVYIGDGGGTLYALDASTGATVWSTTLGNQGLTCPAVAKGIVYVGTNTNGQVKAVDAATGDTLWTKTTGGGVFQSPAVANGIVYVGSNDFYLYALDAATGTTIWKIKYVGAPNAPSVVNGLVLVAGYDRKVRAVDASTGAPVWTSPTLSHEIIAAGAALSGVFYVGTAGGPPDDLYALDVTSGAILWSHQTNAGIASSPAASNGRIFVGYENGHVRALDASTGTLLWDTSVGASINQSSPAVANGVLYIGTFDGSLQALDVSTGAILWSFEAPPAINSSPAVVDGVVYVGSFDKHLYAFGLPN